MSTVYQFDVTETDYIISAVDGIWVFSGNNNFYYARIPLEVGKAYKVTLQNVTTLPRFRVAQAKDTRIGYAKLSMVGYTDTPQDGFSLEFVAIYPYLFCYGGTANGGEVVVTCTSDEEPEEPTATVITYNNETIATLEAGQTATIKTAETEVDYDIVVKAGEQKEPSLQEKTATENGDVLPDEGYDGLSKVTVDVAGKVLPKYDGEVIIEGEPESGGGGGGSAEFNIAYGDTPPEDTTKLWVKANEPEAVRVTSSPVFADKELEAGVSALPVGAHSIAAAAVGTKVYLFGGAKGNTNSDYLSTINVFDTETNTITTLSAKLLKAASSIAYAVVGAKVYLFGGDYGSGQLNTINVFDSESETLTTLSAKLPVGAHSMATAVVGTKVYLFGGYGGGDLSTINVFNTETNTITTLSAKLPTETHRIAAAVVGTKVYLFGGRGASYLSTINVFDTKNNTIATLNTTLPEAAMWIEASTIGTKVYLFGGAKGNTNSDYLSTINVFDTETNTITTLSAKLPTAASSIASAVVGMNIYLFGGGGGGSYLNTINVFMLLMPLATNNMLIEASATKNRFNLLPNVELGVNNVYLGNADGNGERVDAYLHNGTEWVEV